MVILLLSAMVPLDVHIMQKSAMTANLAVTQNAVLNARLTILHNLVFVQTGSTKKEILAVKIA